ncbi:hypothetical protein ACTHGU_14605 [Chitinophagaceae bacterium MMS25-I14]
MQELIQHLVAKAGVTEQQAEQSIHAMKEYIQGKLPPMMHGVIDNFLGTAPAAAADHLDATADTKEEDFLSKAKATAGNVSDKIEDFAKDAGDKIGTMANTAGDKIHDLADKAGDMAEDALNKLKHMFGSDEEKK